MTKSVFDGFKEKKPQRAVLVLLDYAKAYDRIWRAALFARWEGWVCPAAQPGGLVRFLEIGALECDAGRPSLGGEYGQRL